jgi:hypothetical protein
MDSPISEVLARTPSSDRSAEGTPSTRVTPTARAVSSVKYEISGEVRHGFTMNTAVASS